jgi:Lipocalin-like domain
MIKKDTMFSHFRFNVLGVTTVCAALALAGCASDKPDPTKMVLSKWSITNRITNGGEPSLPECAKDDSLEFKADGTFQSLISGTKCNENEIDVTDQKYTWSADKKVITFNNPGFPYTGKVIELTKKKMVIEFDLGPGFVIRDTFEPNG